MNGPRFFAASALAAALSLNIGVALAADTVNIPCVCELSGAGAVAGTNFHDGAHLAVDEINAAGGILGKKIEMTDMDTQTDPMTSRALVQKAIDSGAYAIMGTIYSGSTIVNMMVAQQAGVPQFTGAEAPNITEKRQAAPSAPASWPPSGSAHLPPRSDRRKPLARRTV